MTKAKIKEIRDKALKLYEDAGASAVYEYANTIEGIEYSHCNGCEADTPTLDGECLVCGGIKS